MSIPEQLLTCLLLGAAVCCSPLSANELLDAERAVVVPEGELVNAAVMPEGGPVNAGQAAVMLESGFVDAQQSGLLNIGVPLTEAQVQTLPRHVFSDGAGLPSGSGSVEHGGVLYTEHCARCHGSTGQGGKALELVGDRSLLATDYPDRGIAVYWPYAPTLYEYIDRSMPPETPSMFSADELYALLAHLLYLNGVVDGSVVLDARMLSDIQLPNRDGFDTIGK